MTIFETRPGAVVAVPDAFDQPIPLAIDGWGGYQSTRSIITQMGVMRQGNFQVTNTLEDQIYVYTFGERMGQMQISGLSFSGSCSSGDGAAGASEGNPRVTGIEKVLEFYDQHRVSYRRDPLSVQIGTSAAGRARGFLGACRVELIRPEGRISQYGFQLFTVPNSTNA